jgi:3-hydroxyanthranilate 3,4-dioxygenase
MADLSAFSLTEWIEKNREQLKPPVGNARVLPEGDFIVMAIGGPNLRTDFHDDPGEEIFYQLEGDMILRVMEEAGPRDISIKAGDIFLLPANVRHSPQRPAGSVGLVVERLRKSGELDGFEWFCENCNALLHRAEVGLKDIYKDLPPLFDAYYDDETAQLCKQCGHQNPGRKES